MEKHKVIIVEDEAPARELIKAYLSDLNDIELVAECENGFEAIKAINAYKPDILFLDVQMPKLTGFETLELLDEFPEIIFTTAYDQYALKAFELNAVDYLMKPFSKERFLKAVEKARKRIANKEDNISNVKNLVAQIKEKEEKIDRIFVKTGNKIDVITVDQIIKIEAQDDYAEIFTKEKSYLKKETMTYLENNLPESNFVRVHRSTIINTDYLVRIEKYGKETYMVILQGGYKVTVSKSRIKKLREKLGF
jgi:two-component system LytT family response regulator